MTFNIAEALTDPGLFEPWFPGPSWSRWIAVLKAAYALPMSPAEVELFRTIAERDPPRKRVRELWAVAGRRAGKDSAASVIAAHAAAFFDQGHRLRPGERALVMCLACDRSQAQVVAGYIRSYFSKIPPLAAMVTRETGDGLELNNGRYRGGHQQFPARSRPYDPVLDF
jgi:hypothetical protein